MALLSNDTSAAGWSGARKPAAANQCGHSLGMLDTTIRVALRKSPGEWSGDASSGVQTGTTVLEMLAAFERATGLQVPYQFAPRRPGDVAATWADCSRVESALGWKARRDLEAMCADAWRWQQELGTATGSLTEE